ncbi:MAG TPA: YicC/YloC family endoribonuclease, partial [candidate division Zixibacteria bacterium]|nr:YicC/YloC family endoribonuclease [candidate division Zixibacteria bacterium]
MISSMTGYGRAETSINGAKVTVEISSVNNRFCEIQCRLPKFATDLEPKLKELILSQISRGKIYYNLNWEETSVANLVKLNQEAAEIYFKIIKELKDKYKLKGDIEVEDILTLPNLIKYEREEIEPEKVWSSISKATIEALAQLKQMRQKEGEQLAQDLKKRAMNLEQIVREIEELSQKSVENYRKKLKNRIAELLTEKIVDEQRLALEVAL